MTATPRCLLSLLLLILAGCNKPAPSAAPSSPPPPPAPPVAAPINPEHAAILAVVQANIDAINNEDLDGAMAVFDPDAPGLELSRKVTAQLFDTYDLKYTIEEMTVESVDAGTARVRFSQLTEKVNGPQFRNNRVRGVHILKKRDGVWKFYTTEASGVEFLN